MPRNFQHPLRVRYSECDPQGIVFNANYLLYFDVAFTELWREAVGPWLRHVVVSSETWRPVAMPDWIREGLEAYSSTAS